jgi:hypothetical protein
MMDLPDEELRARLAAITRGPWARGVIEARQELAPVDRVQSSLRGARPIAIDQLVLSASNRRKSSRLSRILRAHFEGGGPVENDKEIKTRDAFDQALTVPQLYELAVQTGYLPEESIRKPARTILTDLLWSEPARRFVLAYDYVSVPMLANRVGISGVASTKPPEPNPNASLHFAGFLAHLRAFHTDEHIQAWVRFLDDYVVEHDEQNRLWEYLREERQKAPRRTGELLTGCQVFVLSLASAFQILSDDELGLFGLMHAYWLQKFFGYKRDRRGLFVKDVDLWGRTDSWARTIATSSRLVPVGTDSAIEKLIRRQFAERVLLLERTFEAVRRLTQETQQTTLRSDRLIQLSDKGLLPQRSTTNE